MIVGMKVVVRVWVTVGEEVRVGGIIVLVAVAINSIVRAGDSEIGNTILHPAKKITNIKTSRKRCNIRIFTINSLLIIWVYCFVSHTFGRNNYGTDDNKILMMLLVHFSRRAWSQTAPSSTKELILFT